MNAGEIRRSLDLGAEFAPWLDALEAVDSDGELRAGDDDEVGALLERLHVPAADIPIVLAGRPADDAVAWNVARERDALVASMGEHFMLMWPTLPAGGPLWFAHVWAYLEALPAVLDYHRSVGIDDDVSWATLADLGRNMAIEHRLFDRAGLDAPWWITLHFKGVIYELGRLQFERFPNALSVHIPESGPMSPDACDASFDRARSFFPRHFPDDGPIEWFRCFSWLLDPQLAEYLPAESNIVQFQRRFSLKPGAEGRPDNDGVLRFVFRAVPPVDLDTLPQDTLLQRVIVEHLRAGRSWHTHAGRIPFR
jgi:hypothetical protein